jgi:hypothetical protein
MKALVIAACIAVSMVGCATTPKQTPTSLQIQSFQTKEFEASKTATFGSVISVFQDLGYIVQSADKDTGFITATSPSSNKTGFWEAMGGLATSGQTKATAFVEEIRPNFVTVRLNFVDTKHVSSSYGQNSDRDTPILDPKPYQVAFDKIETAIFIREGSRATEPAVASP